jgi:dTDP-4-amino-4,6-dideoxygalactose transaminase
VERFEEGFRKYIGTTYAMGVSSCTAALHLSLLAVGIKQGDEVLTTPFTFAATTNAIELTGATPVFVDIDPITMNIDPDLLEERITKKTKAILPVHFAGRPCAMDRIIKIAKKHKLYVIEDAAHAVEAVHHGKKVGNIGDLTCFSFYATKNLVTGEGGMVTTREKEWADKIKLYALHGMSRGAWRRYSDKGFKRYQVIAPGYKYNMMDIEAAIGIHQLKKIEAYLKIRESISRTYDKAFQGMPFKTPAPPEPKTRHARHLYPIVLDLKKLKAPRDKILDDLYHEGIGAGVHFISLHLQPYYKKRYGFKSNDFPCAAAISNSILSLPLSAKLTPKDVQDVIHALTKIIRHYAR